MRSGFARLHPLVDLTFFVLVLAFAMFLSHPAVQLAGLVCAALFALRCTGRGFGRRMAMLLPLMLPNVPCCISTITARHAAAAASLPQGCRFLGRD